MNFPTSHSRRETYTLVAGRSRILRVEPLEDRRLLSATRAAEAINQFAYDVYEHMQNEEGNLFYSPLSVATALTMAYAGAAGQTASEMANVLHVGTEPGIHESYGELMSLLASQTNPTAGFEIDVANAMWPQIGASLESGFIDIVENLYDGYTQSVNYGNPSQAEDIINDWVSDKTHGKIEDLVSDLSPNTLMVLTNALYFKALWQFPFDPQYSMTTSFSLDDEWNYVQTPYMTTPLQGYMTTIAGFQVLEMPFAGGNASMTFMMPVEYHGSNTLTTEVLVAVNEWLDSTRERLQHNVQLPKFEITVSTGFNELLAGLGMPSAFDAGMADFSAMTPIDVFIQKVFHKATIELNEQGTEAAAATEVEFYLCFAEGTLVLTPEGEKRIEELQAGDYVLARDEHDLEGVVEPKMIERTLKGEGTIVELQVGGQTIRTTLPHRFFVRGKGWTPAGEIKVEDRLSTNHGDWIEVEKVLHTEESESVYNLRVAEHRTYFVGSRAWGFGVWVHNDYGGEFIADHPFHFLIRDNETSTITFMGRIDDPTQSENDIAPTVPLVVPATGDFDGDGDVDGRDFLAWQRGYGMTSGAQLANGDSNADGDVDANDLSAWRSSYGQVTVTPLSAMVDASQPTADDSVTAARTLVMEEGRKLAALDDKQLYEAAVAVEQCAVDRAFDYWTPPRRAFADFGDIVTRRVHRHNASSLPAFEF